MDVVYVLKKAKNDCQELRYSLRSLINMKHKKVFIVWYNPSWVKNIIHIEAEDNLWTKYKNVINKYKIICDDERISEDFILMNDDIYILEKLEKLEIYKKCSLKEHLDYIKKINNWKWPYYEVVHRVFELFPEWDSYNTHTPMIYNKKKLKKLLEKYWDQEISIRSLYWNTYKIPASRLDNKKVSDCKIKDFQHEEVNKLFMSSNDWAVHHNIFYKILDSKFSKPWAYEL